MIRSNILTRLLQRRGRNLFCSKSEVEKASEPRQRKTNQPFDSLGYELIQTNTERQAVQRAVIDSIGTASFTISGVRVYGSFALIKLIVPRPDIVLVGTGAASLPLSADVKNFFKKIHVNVEAMDTKNACHTFNVLNQEDRTVAAALFPIEYTEEVATS